MPNRTPKAPAAGPIRETRSKSKPARDAAARAIAETALEEKKLLDQARAKAIENMPKSPPGNRGDGSFHMAFVRMGQGDCTVISTPKGRTILIDCGSDAEEASSMPLYLKKIRDTIYGPKFLQGTNDLDILMLTHADTDHYNKLTLVLDTDTKIQTIYHSSELSECAAGQTSTWLAERITTPLNILKVTLNETGAAKLGNLTMQSCLTSAVPCLDPKGAIKILEEPNCILSLLAGNVATNVGDNSTQRNRGSLMMLIETFGKKILICGDATISTDAFILRKYKTSLTALQPDLMQIPHHGSKVTSSSDDLVLALKPKASIISAGKQVIKDHLPGLRTIQKYLAHHPDDAVPSHEISYYEEGDLGSYFHTTQFITKYLYVTGSNDTIEITLP